MDMLISLPIEWHGVDGIWMTLNCIDRLAFGDIPDQNPMIKSSTEENIFRCWMPFEECNSSSAICASYELVLWWWHSPLTHEFQLMLDAQLGLGKNGLMSRLLNPFSPCMPVDSYCTLIINWHVCHTLNDMHRGNFLMLLPVSCKLYEMFCKVWGHSEATIWDVP